MNTFDRHRQYLLRRQRKRRLFRRALSAAGAVIAVFALWTFLARVGPTRYAPPDPGQVGAHAAKTVARTAAASINRMDARLRPNSREEAKQAVLRLFDRSDTAVTGAAGRNDESRDAAGTCAAHTLAAGRDTVEKDGTGRDHPERGVARRSHCAEGSTPRNPGGDIPEPPAAASAQPHDSSPTAAALPILVPEAGASRESPAPSPRTIDILVLGVDNRLGRDRGRADALHLLTVAFDAPRIRITSIPRGTYSALGYKNKASNIISHVLSARGRGELQRRIARMCARDSVPYYVEIGFSDAYGIIELLGFEDPAAELQALRRRKGYQFGDHNRCYNQGMFIRSAILRMLPLLEGATGELLMRAGFDMVRTNLTLEQCRGIVYLLNDAGLSRAPSLIQVTLRSPFRGRIERKAELTEQNPPVRQAGSTGSAGTGSGAERRIRRVLAEAGEQRGNARQVRSTLWTMFIQHAWLQMKVGEERRKLRDSLAALLAEACLRLSDQYSMEVIRKTLRADDQLFPRDAQAARHPAAAAPRSGPSVR